MKTLKLDDFLGYTFLSNLKCSPNGDVAYIAAKSDKENNSYTRDLWLLKKGKDPVRLTGDGKAGGFMWDDDHTILFSSSRSQKFKKMMEAGEEYTEFYRIDTNGGEAVKAFSIPLSASIVDKIGEGRYLLSVNWDMRFSKAYTMKGKAKSELLKAKKEERDYQVVDELPFYFNGAGFVNKQRNAIFIYEEEGGKLTRVTKETFTAGSVHLDEAKKRVVFTGQSFTAKRRRHEGIYIYDLESGKTETILPGRDYSVYDVIWWGDKLLVIATDGKAYGGNENPKFYTLDPETKEMKLFAEIDYSVGSSVGSDCRLGGGKSWVAEGEKLTFILTVRNASHIYTLSKTGRIAPLLEGEGSVDCIEVSGSTVYFVGMKDMKLQEIYSCKKGSAPVQLTSHNEEALKDVYVAKPEKMTFENDGTEIDGWVLKPRDYNSKKKYPAILDIHGGPKTVYGEVFYHEMQYWANKGYFVFFCNPRGGDGRGNEFADIRGKYGTIDYDDIMKFTDLVLKKYRQIDKDNVGVTGGSYGGFMTNWIIGHTDRFKAAASQRSIANWISFSFISDIGEGFGKQEMGLKKKDNQWNATAKLWEHSPLKYLEGAKTPTLFIHSDEDYRCPLAEGYQMYAALRQQGVDSRLCIFHGENHELSRGGKPTHRVRRLTEITDWFDHYLTK